MGKKLPKKEEGGGLPLWIGTFGDMMSLLLTFFILLLSMATFDAKKLIEAEASISGSLSILDGGIKFEPSRNRITLPADITIPPEYAEQVHLIEQSIIDFNEMPNVSKGKASIVGEGVNGFVITLPTNATLDDNFRINEDSKLFLRRIAQVFAKMPKNTQLEILARSNVANAAINLERASNVALSVGRYLHSLNISGGKINILGREDKTLAKTKDAELLNIRFYAKELPLEATRGILDR